LLSKVPSRLQLQHNSKTKVDVAMSSPHFAKLILMGWLNEAKLI
jgi:hypothetical protein